MVDEFKERMHMDGDDEDDNLRRLLSFSVASLQDRCGEFDVEENHQAKELVFERTRYAYNDALEYFDDNFLSDITNLGLSLMPKDDADATV